MNRKCQLRPNRAHSSKEDGAFYGNFSPATSTDASLQNHICIAFSDITSAQRISVLHEAQKVLQLSYAKSTLEVERNNTST